MDQFANKKIIETLTGILMAATILLVPPNAKADEGGVGLWIPGFFGSLAAAPLVPGFSFATVYYHDSVTAGSNVAFARQVTLSNIHTNFTSNLNINLNANVDLLLFIPSYTFAKPLLGGQAMIAVAIPAGHAKGHVSGTLTGNFGLGPGFTISGARTDQVTGMGDLAPMFSLRWNFGVHNVMTFMTGNIPVGAYSAGRLANLGINHNALDAGAGYTYFNEKSGGEFSAVSGYTYNFPNNTTHYRNGNDLHMDASASKFFAQQIQIGLVGYGYQQVSCDSGSGDRVGCFKGRIYGIGPQIGYIIPGTKHQVYINLKGYDEFGAQNRAKGWNVWLTLSLSPTPPLPSLSG